MLDFTTINVDGEYRHWSFDSIEELREEYHREDYRICCNDDPVTEMEFFGIPMYVDSFDDIVKLFGLEEKTDRGEENNEIDKAWEALYIKYPMDRDLMSPETEKSFVEECFDLYEKEGFAKKFWSPYGDYKERVGQSFEVVERCKNGENCDIGSMPMWNIRFEDGAVIGAYPEEIIPRDMRENGCLLEGIE